jgi:hypothetical protein
MSPLLRAVALAALASMTADGLEGAGRQATADMGRISGRVSAAGTGEPIPGATIRLAGTRGSRTTTSDADGYYEIEEVPPGYYLLSAVSADYAIGVHGQRDPADRPRSFELRAREFVGQVDVQLTPLGRISGRILDGEGRPAASVGVSVVRWARTVTDVPVQAGGSTRTGADGTFSISGLHAGTYYVLAGIPSTPIPAAPPAPFGLAAVTYYPGTSRPGDAQTVRVELGAERANVEFTLQPSRLARVGGVVLDTTGRPIEDGVVLFNGASSAGAQMQGTFGTFSEIDDEGRFSLSGVPPGSYSLDVWSKSAFESIARTGGAGVGTVREGSPEFASVTIDVGGDDIENLIVRTQRGFTLSGQVILEGAPPFALRNIPISATAGGEASMLSRSLLSGATSTGADGTFQLRKLVGPQWLSVGKLPADWGIKRVSVGGFEVTDELIDVAHDDSRLEVLIARLAGVAGRVGERRGVPVAGATVIVFAEDRRRWTQPFTRSVRSVLAGPNGAFAISGLPRGRYYAAAVPALIEGKVSEPDDLEALVEGATRFSLGDGERRLLDLRVE